MFSRKLTRFVAAGAAAVAVAIGGVAISNSSSGNSASGTANVAQPAGPGNGPRSPHLRATGGARSGRIPTGQKATTGQIPAGWHPGAGTLITGATAEKAKAAALAKYSGTVNRVLHLSDGSYAVHLLGTSGPHHVFVSKEFKVTGTA
jgi:hypothetical protein